MAKMIKEGAERYTSKAVMKKHEKTESAVKERSEEKAMKPKKKGR